MWVAKKIKSFVSIDQLFLVFGSTFVQRRIIFYSFFPSLDDESKWRKISILAPGLQIIFDKFDIYKVAICDGRSEYKIDGQNWPSFCGQEEERSELLKKIFKIRWKILVISRQNDPLASYS